MLDITDTCKVPPAVIQLKKPQENKADCDQKQARHKKNMPVGQAEIEAQEPAKHEGDEYKCRLEEVNEHRPLVKQALRQSIHVF